MRSTQDTLDVGVDLSDPSPDVIGSMRLKAGSTSKREIGGSKLGFPGAIDSNHIHPLPEQLRAALGPIPSTRYPLARVRRCCGVGAFTDVSVALEVEGS